MAEHEATCQHRTESCEMCGTVQKTEKFAQHQLVCLKRQVVCDNHGCSARVAFDTLAAHKANDCGYEEVGCPFADMGCTARMLRKDIDSHEDAALKQHNRLLLGKVKEQQQTILLQQQTSLHQQQVSQQAQEDHEKLKRELKEVKGAHAVLRRAHERLQTKHEELRDQVGYEIVLRVKHAVLTGRKAFVPLHPSHPTRVYSEDKVVHGHRVCVFVGMKDDRPVNQVHYGVHLEVADGFFPCKAICTLELVHHDGNPQSAVKKEGEYTFTEAWCWGSTRFISKARLASPDNNPYVNDGYVTFKCTFKVVDE
jgi:hypothetical protein